MTISLFLWSTLASFTANAIGDVVKHIIKAKMTTAATVAINVNLFFINK